MADIVTSMPASRCLDLIEECTTLELPFERGGTLSSRHLHVDLNIWTATNEMVTLDEDLVAWIGSIIHKVRPG